MVIQPSRPTRLALAPVHWRSCNGDICISVTDFRIHLKNQVKVAKWMMKMNALVDYYEVVTENKAQTAK